MTSLRVAAVLLLILTTCCAQSNQSQVEAVLQQMERAQQTGDFNTYVGLWTHEKAGEIEHIRPYAVAQPGVRYQLMSTYVRGDQAVILAQAAADNFLTMMLRKEGGQWKIADQLWRNTAANPKSVYALLPPEPGAFARAGSPWDQVAPGMDPAKAAQQGWQMKAVFDESYLYIRFISNEQLPAPGSTGDKSPGNWPVLKIDTSDAGEFVLYDAVNIGDQATFGKDGKATSHRPYPAYMIRMERKDHEVFSTTAALDPSPLLDISGRNYDIRIPLATMGITDSRATKMTIGDAQWPKSAVLSFAVQRY